MTTLETALKLLQLEQAACIPVGPDKRPKVAWSRYAETLPTEADCHRWFDNGASIALLAGRIQCLDVDTKHADQGLWHQLLQRLEDVGLGPVLERLLIQRTPSGGYHLVWRCEAELRNVKLAENARKEVILETRGAGGYFVISPSPGYRLIQGDWSAIPTLTEEERDDLLAVARSFNEHQPREFRPQVPPGAETTPGDDFDVRGDVTGLLLKHGWSRADGSGHYWTRPGKDRGISASWNIVPGRFYVFTTSTAFEAQHVYRPWHVFAVLECDGDFTAAARRLAEMGYGAPKGSRRGVPYPHTPAMLPTSPEGSQEPSGVVIELPPILSRAQEQAADWPTPVEIVKGVLYRGAKGMIAGPSKSRKTFLLTDLAVSVASGVGWLGIPTTQVPVLYVNLELQDFAYRKRREEIEKVKLSGAVGDYPLFGWHLRGYGVNLPVIRGQLLRHCETEGIGLIILDPTYKLNHHGEENAADDVGRLMNEFEQVGREANATVVFCHHFAKGIAADKNSIDRVSGSGVWARDPDAIMMFSPHEEEDCMIVETHLRNFPAIGPFVVRWCYPVWERDLTADPTAHRKPVRTPREAKNPPHRPPSVTSEDVIRFMDTPGRAERCNNMAALAREAAAEWKLSERQARRILNRYGISDAP